MLNSLRRSSSRIACFALVLLLFSQLALASQACLSLCAHWSGHSNTHTTGHSPCDNMPADTCLAQLSQSNQLSDTAFPSVLPIAAVLIFVGLLLGTQLTFLDPRKPFAILIRQGDPPCSILFCRFQN